MQAVAAIVHAMPSALPLLLAYLGYAITLSFALSRAGFRANIAPANSPDSSAPNRILILGATGGTGRALLAQALERGLHVTVLVRNPARLKVEHPRLRVITGDVLDPSAVAEAMRGQEAVLSALGHKRFLGPSRILSQGTRNLLQAMEAAGARRFVCETSLGIGDSSGRLGLLYTLFTIPVILPFYFWDKTRQERSIAASSREWVIVRPGALTHGAPRGSVRHGRGVGNYLWTVRVARADVARFMLDQLTSNAYLRTAVGIAA